MIKSIILSSTLAFVGLTALAKPHEVGNGGNAILVNGRYYSFDLFESGVEQNPHFIETSPTDPRIVAHLRKNLDERRFPIATLAKKVSEFSQSYPYLSWALVEAMGFYKWHFINGPLAPVDDNQDSIAGPTPPGLTQAAIRQQEVINVSAPIWNSMDDANRAALVLHEMMYALMIPHLNDKNQVVQDAAPPRRFVGFIFSPDFSAEYKLWWFFTMGEFYPPDENVPDGYYYNPLFIDQGGDRYLFNTGSAESPSYWFLGSMDISSPQPAFNPVTNQESVANLCDFIAGQQSEGQKLIFGIVPLSLEYHRSVEVPTAQGKIMSSYPNGWVSIGDPMATHDYVPVEKTTCAAMAASAQPASLP